MKLLKKCIGMLVLFSLPSIPVVHAVQPDCAQIRATYQCPSVKKKVTISFDDGISDVTPKVLDVLKREKVPGLFFVLGNKVDCRTYENSCKQGNKAQCQSLNLCKQRVNTLSRMKREGHMIGSHSYHHDRHSELPANKLQWNIQKSKLILANSLTTEPPLFRLPFGDGWFNQKAKPQAMDAVKRNGFEHIGWEMTAYDWNVDYQNGDKILDNVMKQMCSDRGRQGVVVFHDGDYEKEHAGRAFTANNLGRWIPMMRCAADFVPITFFKKNLRVK